MASRTLEETLSDYRDRIEALERRLTPTPNLSSFADATSINTQLAGKAPLASPAFTGKPTAPTADPASGDANTNQVATTAFVTVAGQSKAPLNSPAFTGNPTGPTHSSDDFSAALATTAFVGTAIGQAMRFRGNWASNTTYAKNDVAVYAGWLYVANANFTSGSSWNLGNWTKIAQLDANAPGDIKLSGSGSVPSGWLTCNGAAVSRSTYASLFSAIGTTYGNGDGSSTFNLPDLRDTVAVGDGGSLGSLGAEGGEATHTLSVGEMPSHTHTQNAHGHSVSDPGHNHSQNSHNHSQNSHDHGVDSHTHSFSATTSSVGSHSHGVDGWGGYMVYVSGQAARKQMATSSTSGVYAITATDSGNLGFSGTTDGQGGHSHTLSGTTGGTTVNVQATTASNNATTATNNSSSTGIGIGSTTASNQNTGGGGAHNNMQPYVVLRYLIKT